MYVDIKKSNRGNKKYMAIFYDANKKRIKTTHFGAVGYADYTVHKDEFRKERYLNRHRNENWNDYMTAGSLSKHILWSYTDFDKAVREYMKKFNLQRM